MKKESLWKWTAHISPAVRRFSNKYCFLPQINDIVGEFEQEKFEMQKHHTKSIQEILDDTNARLQKMEKEYSQQTLSTVGDITKF